MDDYAHCMFTKWIFRGHFFINHYILFNIQLTVMNLLNNSTAVYCVDTLTERGAKQKVAQPIKEVLEV